MRLSSGSRSSSLFRGPIVELFFALLQLTTKLIVLYCQLFCLQLINAVNHAINGQDRKALQTKFVTVFWQCHFNCPTFFTPIAHPTFSSLIYNLGVHTCLLKTIQADFIDHETAMIHDSVFSLLNSLCANTAMGRKLWGRFA